MARATRAALAARHIVQDTGACRTHPERPAASESRPRALGRCPLCVLPRLSSASTAMRKPARRAQLAQPPSRAEHATVRARRHDARPRGSRASGKAETGGSLSSRRCGRTPRKPYPQELTLAVSLSTPVSGPRQRGRAGAAASHVERRTQRRAPRRGDPHRDGAQLRVPARHRAAARERRLRRARRAAQPPDRSSCCRRGLAARRLARGVTARRARRRRGAESFGRGMLRLGGPRDRAAGRRSGSS